MVVLMIPNSCNVVPTHNERRPSVYNDDFEYIPVVKPIRVLQFLLTSGILALTIYTILNESPYTESIKILLILVFGTYAFIALIDIISQLSGDPIPDTPVSSNIH
ncbi:hypothetical protein KPH14_008586 [Odynerus spinipes]|uniref:Uncharacterized protein n=1 Tax=Odynerus spinipes TaxID=1348599 RepID=A0AAD9RSL0_9HYME|nr:hypothetical protein KPH14_008586 [Odynerus spinipes]